jgi:hypothetical protein
MLKQMRFRHLAGIALLVYCARVPVWGDDGGLVRNNAFHWDGKGNGTAIRSGSAAQHLSDVSVDIDRGGRILVSFRTGTKKPLTFSGSVIDAAHDMLKADVASDDPARLRGSMYVSRDARDNITRILLEATNGQEHLHLDWSRHR